MQTRMACLMILATITTSLLLDFTRVLLSGLTSYMARSLGNHSCIHRVEMTLRFVRTFVHEYVAWSRIIEEVENSFQNEGHRVAFSPFLPLPLCL
ncbi:hypothetical protein BJ912DRAFT_950005, partial [Pholiota molesta]